MSLSSFEQTQYEADQLFYATFPAARDAAHYAPLDLPGPEDCPTLHGAQSLEFDIRNEMSIGTSV
jgi:hypothetical protein